MNYLVLHLSVLQNTLTAEHASIIFAIELDLLRGMNVAETYAGRSFGRICLIIAVGSSDAHWKSGEDRVVDWQILRA